MNIQDLNLAATPGDLREAIAVALLTAPAMHGDIEPAIRHIRLVLQDYIAQRFQVALCKCTGDDATQQLLKEVFADLVHREVGK